MTPPSSPRAGEAEGGVLDAERLKQAMLNVGSPDGIESHRMDFQLGFAVIHLSQQQLAVWFAEQIANEYAALASPEPDEEARP